MTDLAQFVLARIAHDEQVARAAVQWSGNRWSAGRKASSESGLEVYLEDLNGGSRLAEFTEHAEAPGDGRLDVAYHVARHDPARVLADCAASGRSLISTGGVQA